jgi:hypothetical protein
LPASRKFHAEDVVNLNVEADFDAGDAASVSEERRADGERGTGASVNARRGRLGWKPPGACLRFRAFACAIHFLSSSYLIRGNIGR